MFRNISKAAILLVLFLIIRVNLFSQEVQAEAHADSTTILIGDQFTLTLKVSAAEGTKIVFPNPEGNLGPFEIISEGKTDTSVANSRMTLTKAYVLTCFDSGAYTIPSLVFMYEKKGMSELYPAQTKPISIKVGIPKLGSDIIDIKKPLEEPLTFWDYFPYLIAGLLLIAATLLLLWYYKRRKPKEQAAVEIKPEPKIPAHILAFAALDKLKSEKLWQKGEIKEHYIKLTEILRTYIERRFGVNALEMTSEEILDSLDKIMPEKSLHEKLYYILDKADLTKFAKHTPDEAINNSTLDYTYNFINSSKESEHKTEAGN